MKRCLTREEVAVDTWESAAPETGWDERETRPSENQIACLELGAPDRDEGEERPAGGRPEPVWFDRLTQMLTHTLARRGLGGLTAGASIALAGMAGADAKSKKRKKKKKKKGAKPAPPPPPPCTADCAGKSCGSDGCGGSCGDCDASETCNGEGQCVCAPDCAGKECGGDGCGGSCGTCSGDETCNGQGQCVCTPDCAGKECGGDGCGGSCGTCSGDETCNGQGQCVCGNVICGTTCCGPAELCDANGQCAGESGNLIVNGGAEAGNASPDGEAPPSGGIPGWTLTLGETTVVEYGNTTGGFPLPTDPGPPDRGEQFFSGGTTVLSISTQTIDVSANALRIDAGDVEFEFSGYLGGFRTQGDSASVAASFRDEAEQILGSVSIGPVSAEDRNDQTGLFLRSTTGQVPAGTRDIVLSLEQRRVNSSFNDGYADNLSLVLRVA
jgi:hypothetical protein